MPTTEINDLKVSICQISRIPQRFRKGTKVNLTSLRLCFSILLLFCISGGSVGVQNPQKISEAKLIWFFFVYELDIQRNLLVDAFSKCWKTQFVQAYRGCFIWVCLPLKNRYRLVFFIFKDIFKDASFQGTRKNLIFLHFKEARLQQFS